MDSMDANMSMTESDNQDFHLEHFQKERVLQNLGGIIFVSLLMSVGFAGNSVAIVVYLRKYKKSSYRTFIVSLAIIDLATCCAPMMIIILGLINPINKFSSWMCRMSSFLIYSMCFGSSAVLVTIAVERYRKICVPHGMQLSARMSKYICIFDVLLGILLAWPAAVLYGNKSVKNGQDQILGTKCDVSDDFADTKYPVYFNIFFLFFVLATLIALSTIYFLIGKQIFRMKKIISRRPPNKISQNDLVTTEFNPSPCSLSAEESKGKIVQNICDNIYDMSTTSKEANGLETRSVENISTPDVFKEQDSNQNDNESKQNKTIAVTRVFFIITGVYFCSFLPFFALRLATFLNKEFIPSLSFAGTVAYQMFRWTFFINNMANPIIYAAYDRKFIGEFRMLCFACLGQRLKIKPKTRW